MSFQHVAGLDTAAEPVVVGARPPVRDGALALGFLRTFLQYPTELAQPGTQHGFFFWLVLGLTRAK